MFGADALHAVDGFGDFAIAGALLVAVHRLQHMAGAAALLIGQPAVRSHPTIEEGVKQLRRRFNAIQSAGVKRNEGRQGCIVVSTRQSQQVERSTTGGMREMSAQSIVARIEFQQRGMKIAVGREETGEPFQQDAAGMGVGGPEDGGLFSRQRRPDESTASPIAGEREPRRRPA